MDTNLSTMAIEQSVLRWFDCPRQNTGLCNISWGLLNHEVDVAILTKSHYITEIEIKRSLSDFKADFKKKHHHDDDVRIKKFYYCVPEKIVENVMSILKEKVNDGTLKKVPCALKYDEQARLSLVKESGSPELKLDGCRPLNDKETIQFLRLGTMRLFETRENLSNTHRNYSQLLKKYNEGTKAEKIRTILNKLYKDEQTAIDEYYEFKYKIRRLDENSDDERNELEEKMLDVELKKTAIQAKIHAYQDMLTL